MADPKLTVQINGEDNLSRVLKSMESNVIRFVGAVSSALTSLTAVGFPVVSAANYQKELLAAAKTTQYNKEQIDDLRKSLTELSTTVNVSAVDLAKIATMGGQIGIGENNVEALVSFVESIAIAVSSLDVSAEEAVQSMGKLINIFGLAPNEFNKVVSSLTAVSVASTASAESLFDVVRRIGSLGGSVTLPQAAALSASMIDLGLTAETAGTTITKIFADMKAKAAEFAAVAVKANADATGSLRFTTEEWVDLVKTDGLEALRAYVAGLSRLSTADSARIKGALTGEGRLFEAVTKMEMQEKKRAILVHELANAEDDLQKLRNANPNPIVLGVEEDRVSSLREAVKQASILDRLLNKANAAYTGGMEGIKAQQTVLAGLVAQWDVFKNNIIAAANAVGEVLIPPITNILRGFSESMKASNAQQELADAAKGIVDILRTTTAAIAELRDTLRGSFGSGTGFNWGAALNLVAIGGAKLLLSGLASVLRSLDASIFAAVPGLQTLRDKLIGVTEAERKLREEQAASSTKRTGRIFSVLRTRSDEQLALWLNQEKRISDAKKRLEDRLATSPDLTRIRATLASGNASLANALAEIPKGFSKSLAGVRAEIQQIQLRFEQLKAQGRTTDAWGLLPQLSRWQEIEAKIQRATAAVVGQRVAIERLEAPILSRIRQLDEMSKGRGTGSAFTAMTKALLGINAQPAKAQEVPKGVLDSMGQYVLRVTGLADAWNLAGTAASRNLVIMVAGVRTAVAAVKALFSALASLVNVVFFAVLIKQVLEMVGLWDTLLSGVQKLYALLGGNVKALPDFLKTKEQLGEANKEAVTMVENYKLVTQEASKFTKEVGVALGLLRSSNTAIKDLTFNPNDPGKSQKTAMEGIKDVYIGYNKINAQVERLKELESLLAAKRAESAKLVAETSSWRSNFSFLKKGDEEKLKDVQSVIATLTKEKQDIESFVKSTGGTLGATFENLSRSIDSTLLPSLAQARDATVSLFTSSVKGIQGNPYAGLERVLENILPKMMTAKEAAALFGKEGENATSLWEDYGKAVEAARRAEIALESAKAEATSKLGNASDKVAEQIAAQQNVTALAEKLETLKGKVTEYDTAIKGASRSVKSMGELLKFISEAPEPRAVGQLANAAQKVAERVGFANFKGDMLPKVKAGDLLETGVELQLKTKLKDLYGYWAKIAGEEASRAKNFANEALGEMERRLKENIAFLVKIDEAVARSRDKAKEQKSNRAADAESRQRMRDLQTEQDKERALLQETFGIQQRQLSELEAGGIRVFDDKMSQYGYEQQALFELDERYRKLREAQEDRLNLQKARKGVADEVAQFDKLIAKVNYYKQRVVEANSVISNSKAPLEEQVGAVQMRNDALNKMRGSYTQLESVLERISNVDPIGGEIVANPADIERLKQSLTRVATDIGQVGLAAADKIEPIFKSLETGLSGNASTLGIEIEMLQGRFKELALVSEQYGGNLDKAATAISKMISSVPELRSAMGDMDKLLAQGLSDVRVTNLPALQQISAEMAKGIVSAIPKAMGDQGVITAASNIAKANILGTAGGATATLDNVIVSPAALQAINDTISEKVQPKVTVTAEIKWRDASGQLNITYNGQPIGQKARGGPIMRNAAGSYIQGPGSGTSDSILSWLSNGEYVIDSFTTGVFGPSFFAMLQAAARAGNALSFLKRLAAPRFNLGGPAGQLSSFSGIETDFKNAMSSRPRDVTEIHLHSDKGMATIYAEREQAKALINVLNGYQKVK